MIDWDKPIETDTGKEARLLFTAEDDRKLPRLVLYKNYFDSWQVMWVSYNGAAGEGIPRIRNVPTKEKRTYWVNLYPGDSQSMLHSSRERAVACRDNDCLATKPITITFTRGEGL